MSRIDDIAATLFGGRRVEEAAIEASSQTYTITGTASTASEDGSVWVRLSDDVTRDESVGVPEAVSGTALQLPTTVHVASGDEVIVTVYGGTISSMVVTGIVGRGDEVDGRICAIEADYVKADVLEANYAHITDGVIDNATIGHADVDGLSANYATIASLDAAKVRIGNVEADTAKIHDLTAEQLSAATAYIASLNADDITAASLAADVAKIHDLTAQQLSAAAAYIAALVAGSVTAQAIIADHGDFATVKANAAKVANLTAAELEADHAAIGTLDTDYLRADMSNTTVGWIENGTIKEGAISNAMIGNLRANKITGGTLDASKVTVTNLQAKSIQVEKINGVPVTGKSVADALTQHETDLSDFENDVDDRFDAMQAEIDGAIETWTGTAVPTLNNAPANGWTTDKVKDTHVGDVYFVVNSSSQQNGYNYRFSKSTSGGQTTYSWQLIKDSDVTAALQRLTTAEGKIGTIEQFDSDISAWKTDTDEELSSMKTAHNALAGRVTTAEGTLATKVDTTTFNNVKQTVDENSSSITQMTTTLSNKADSSTVTAVTNRVSKNEQDISGINTTIGELQETVETKADGSTVSTISNKLNTVSDTVDGHTSQLTSITSTQTTMQSTLDKTVKSSIQLWYSKANTTAPSKPTSQVTSTSTDGGAWRTVVPSYNASYPNYYYCWQYEYTDGTYGWSAVVRDIAMGESQATARTADSNASAAVTTANTASTNASTALTTANTANTNASEAKTTATTASTTASEAKTTAETAASDASTAKTNAASAVSTANSASTTATNAQSTANANIKSSVQLWFTKANSTAPNKPTSVVSTSNANTANAWNLVVPVWNSSYPHYFYCYQQQKGDGTYQWTDVVYDRATSEAQQLANTTSTNLSTLQTNYATFKQTTEQFESTVGSRLTTIESDIDGVEERVSDNETSISNNASAIALKANSSDVYTKSAVDGKITQEVTDRNAAITAKANEITSTVSQTYTTKQEFADLEVGGRNLLLNTGDYSTWDISPAGSTYLTRYDDCVKFTPPATSQWWTVEAHNAYIALDDWDTSATYTASLDVKFDNLKSVPTYPSIEVATVTDNATVGYSKRVHRIELKCIPTASGWAHFEHTFSGDYSTWISAGSGTPTHVKAYIWLYLNTSNCDAVYFRNLKLERGNKATDWTPAPEDIESRVDKAESSITQNATNINAKVSKNDVINQINLSTEGVLIDADRVEINGTAVFNAIKSSTDTAYDAKGAAATVQSNLDNLDIGGRNLLPWSSPSAENLAKVASPTTYNSFVTEDGYPCYKITSASTNGAQYASNAKRLVKLIADTTYTYSAWVKVTTTGSDTSVSLNFSSLGHFTVYNSASAASDKTHEDVAAKRIYSPGTVTIGEWTNITLTFTTNSLDGSTFGVYPKYTLGDAYTVYIRDQKLEKGNKATDWTPAPEDVAADIAAAQATANAAAPKANAVARSQRIYYRKTSSGAPAANTTWLDTSGTGYGNWSLKIPPLTTGTGTSVIKYPYLYTAVQTQTVAQQAAGTTCSCSTVLIDDTSTVIDGGNIITGTVSANAINATSGTFAQANIPALTADHIKANVISAVNNGTGTINADKINVSGITIGYDQVEDTPTIPSTVAELSDASDYAKQSALTAEINQRKAAYATSSTAAGTQGKVANCANFALYTGASVTVTFSNANTHATPTLNVNSTGAKSIRGYTGAALTAAEYKWAAGAAITFVYDGTYWRMQDGGAQQATADAACTATNYITHVDNNGITIHPQSGTSNRVAIDADGMEVFKGNVSVASYGDTARIGAASGNNALIDTDGMKVRNGTSVLAQFASSLIEIGKNSTSAVVKFCNGMTSMTSEVVDSIRHFVIESTNIIEIRSSANGATSGTFGIDLTVPPQGSFSLRFVPNTSNIEANLRATTLRMADVRYTDYAMSYGMFKVIDMVNNLIEKKPYLNSLSVMSGDGDDVADGTIATNNLTSGTISASGSLEAADVTLGKGIKLSGINFGFSSATTNSNGITTFNPGLGVAPTAVFVAPGKASNETEAVAKIAVPMVWSIDSATQVQIRWQRSDTNAWLVSNAVGWYWLALYSE